MRLPFGVALLSAALLAYEVLLVRVFAIGQFHHFASMAIGVAMTGFGAAGVLMAVARPATDGARAWLAAAAAIAPALLVLGPAAAHLVPLDATRLPWDRAEWWRLGLVCLALAAPIVAGSLAILSALALAPARPGLLYGASFAGSGLGAGLALGTLAVMRPDRALAVPAFIAALATAAFAAWPDDRAMGGTAAPEAGAAANPARSAEGRGANRRAPWSAFAAAALIVGAVIAAVRPPWPLAVSPYKGLPQVEAFPGARRVAERAGACGWTVAVAAPGFRDAPGLSLGCEGPFPAQTALFVDGESCGAVADWSGPSAALLDCLPSSLAYAGRPRDRVLVLGGGGNTEVWNAAAHGARQITAVELDPSLIALAREPAPRDAEVRWVAGDARSFLARGDGGRFDLITIGPAGGLGSNAAGVHALREDFLRTVEAYEACLLGLAPGGALAVTCWLAAPPREGVRLVLTAAEALRRGSPGAISRGLVVCRGWGTVTVLVQPSGFDPGELRGLRRWARERQFDLDWDPAIASGEDLVADPGAPGGVAPRSGGARVGGPASDSAAAIAPGGFHSLDPPVIAEAARAASAGPEAAAAYTRAYPFAVAPAVDARPYPHHFLRPGSVLRLARGDPGRWLPFAEWGPLALVATLAQSALLAAALMLLPLALPGAGLGRPRLAVVAYFGAIGLGYMAAEIAAIPPLSLLLGHPVYAVTAVLALLLLFSGLGSAWSDRVEGAHAWRIARLLAVALLLGAALLVPFARALAGAPLPVRAAAALAVLGPAGFLMGMPFALGLRSFHARGEPPALAWAANGFASVVAAPFAALVALAAGTHVLLAVAAAGYAAAALVHRVTAAVAGAGGVAAGTRGTAAAG